MAFVKLDCGILDSTLWPDREGREMFITALLMAEPKEIIKFIPTIAIRTLEPGGYSVPPGWYGFVSAASTGIARRAGLDNESGLSALERLSSPEAESRTPDHGGRRLVRVDGGFIVLNFDLYRKKDYTAAERSRRYREKKFSSRVSTIPSRVSSRSVTQAEAEAEAEADKGRGGKSTPTLEEVKLCVSKAGLPESDAVWFWNKCEGNGWTNNGVKIKRWPNVIAAWKAAGYMASQREQKYGSKTDKPNPRNIGVCEGPDYGAAAARKQLRQQDAERNSDMAIKLDQTKAPDATLPP